MRVSDLDSKLALKKMFTCLEVLLWCRGPGSSNGCSCGTSHNCGAGSIRGLGTSMCLGYSLKKKKKIPFASCGPGSGLLLGARE